MKKLPKFVVSRLALRQQHRTDHPNPDLLTAFAEGRLSSRGRAGVLGHLGKCPECRELVALISAGEESRVSSFSKVRRGVWWRWAAPVAVACLVAAVVWGPESVWKSPGPPPAPAITNGAAMKTLPSIEPEPQKAKVERQAKQSKALQSPTVHKKTVTRETTAPVTKQRAEIAATAVPGAPPGDGGVREHAQGFISNAAPRFHSQIVADRREESLWSLPSSTDASGIVQRSEDGGKTWESVRVDGRSRFYALSAAGAEIWVGGADGALFHSVDNGAHWTPVVIADGERRLTGTITRIDAHDDRVVKLKVQGEGYWGTMDGGLHWRLE